MKVYYSKGWALTFVIAGVVLLTLNLILINLTHQLEPYRLVPIALISVIGILYFFQPYFELQEKSLITFSLFGIVSKRFSFEDISELTFEGNKLYRSQNGKLKRIRISKFICDKSQWEKFVLMVEGAEPGGELHE